MPIGCVSLVGPVVERMHRDLVRKQSISDLAILDLGIGFGFYGATIRQWFDAGVKPYRSYLMGVEGFGQYRSACWGLYDYVHQTTIQAYLSMPLSQTDRFDTILLMDVIEHFEKEEGQRVVEQIKARLKPNGLFFVATPGIWCEQGAVYGNELERHLSLWTQEDLTAMGFDVLPSALSFTDGEVRPTTMFDGKTVDACGNLMLAGVYVGK